MSERVRDIALLAVFAALAVAVLLPVGQRDGEEAGEPPRDGGSIEIIEGAPEDGPARVRRGGGEAAPTDDLERDLMPVVPGARWTYRVEGPRDLVPDSKWTMKIATAPEGDEPGSVEVGFGDRLELSRMWLDERGSLRFDGLPLTEPPDFLGDRPREVEGALLPAISLIGKGAVWRHVYRRDVVYRYRDKKGRLHEDEAEGIQTDRANMWDFEDVFVPAGRFRCHRISWIGRIELRVDGRPVLTELTADPYREETTWFAPGVGLVRRRISHRRDDMEVVTFDLVEHEVPSARGADGRAGRGSPEGA